MCQSVNIKQNVWGPLEQRESQFVQHSKHIHISISSVPSCQQRYWSWSFIRDKISPSLLRMSTHEFLKTELHGKQGLYPKMRISIPNIYGNSISLVVRNSKRTVVGNSIRLPEELKHQFMSLFNKLDQMCWSVAFIVQLLSCQG